jgi:nucleotide-binding universal stress UspA family protein
MYKKIILPTDGSKQANKAAKHAMWIANYSNAEIIILNVIETSTFSTLHHRKLKKEMKQMLKGEGNKAIEDIEKIYEKEEYNIKITSLIEEGSPAEKILDLSEKEDVDLIVMGTSGKHNIDRFLIGSVAEKVVRSSKIPVLVVH